jgi:Copper type II ascorbate-dependent monooxygenase, N-terminal domain/Copper type II ascorbate-dependent monooxygenase, C-terminal domain
MAGALACSTGDPAAPSFVAEPLPTPTYHRDVAPILTRSCIKCHYEGGIGPFALTSYKMARAMAPASTAAVVARRMPPWGAHDTSGCKPPLPWLDDERLSDDEIDILKRWDAVGAPEGDPSEAPVEAAPLQSVQLVMPTLELSPRTEYQPTVTSADEFRCFVLDAPELDAGGFVSAINVLPGNRKIVHHVTVFADVGGIASSRAGADGSFECSGGGSVGQAVDGVTPTLTWLLAWAPGGRPLELPSNLGIAVQPRSKLVMEVHYSMGPRTPEPDRTRLQIVMAPATPEYSLLSWGVGNYGRQLENGDGLQPSELDRDGVVEFRIPANAKNHVEEMQQTFDVAAPLPIFGLRAHAHLAAVDLKVDLLRDGAELCLLQDRWDFHWQRVYAFDAPMDHLPTVRAGDKIRLRCTYDNDGESTAGDRALVARPATHGYPTRRRHARRDVPGRPALHPEDVASVERPCRHRVLAGPLGPERCPGWKPVP